MAQVDAKFPPRLVDNHSFGIPDFETSAKQLSGRTALRHSSQDLTKAGKTWRDSRLPCRKNVAFPRLRFECMAGSAGTRELSSDP
jgi:hypothetical protein